MASTTPTRCSRTLTARDDSDTRANWAQREYVCAKGLGYGFAAHEEWWHYRDDRTFCYSLLIGVSATMPMRQISHGMIAGLDWLKLSAAGVVEELGRSPK